MAEAEAIEIDSTEPQAQYKSRKKQLKVQTILHVPKEPSNIIRKLCVYFEKKIGTNRHFKNKF